MDFAVAEPLFHCCRELFQSWHPLDLLPLLRVARGWHGLFLAALRGAVARVMQVSPHICRGLLCHTSEAALHRAYLEYARQVEGVRQSWVRYAGVWQPRPRVRGPLATESWVAEPALQQPVLRQRMNERPNTPDVYRYLERLENEIGCPLPRCYVAMMEAACQPELEAQGEDALPPLGELVQDMHWTPKTRPMHGLPGMNMGPGMPAPGAPCEPYETSPRIKRTESSIRFQVAHFGEQSEIYGIFVHILYLEWTLNDGVPASTQYVLARINDYDPEAEAIHDIEQVEHDIASFATFEDVLRECTREYSPSYMDSEGPVRFRLSELDARFDRMTPS